MTQITITLPTKEKRRLERLATHYGLSMIEFTRQVLRDAYSEFEEESFSEYKNQRTVKASLKRALDDYRMGRTSVVL